MGASLAVAALQHRELSHRTMRALMLMALTAHDQDDDEKDIPAAHYFGGWVRIAEALGYADPGSESARREVGRIMADLCAQGLCKPLGTAGGGRGRQTYLLTL